MQALKAEIAQLRSKVSELRLSLLEEEIGCPDCPGTCDIELSMIDGCERLDEFDKFNAEPLANAIVEHLFTDFSSYIRCGAKIGRLVLEREGKDISKDPFANAGGWSRGPARDAIQGVIERAFGKADAEGS